LNPAPIGVFDSGIGGLSVLAALRAELPHEHFVYIADAGFAPYGERDTAHVVGRSRWLTQWLRTQHDVKAVVVACNTATAAAIHHLRDEHPGLPLVGVEPALKPAVNASRTRRIGVWATRGTLASAKFATLHASLADQATFVLQPCDGLAEAIEHEASTGDATKTIALCDQYMRTTGQFGVKNDEIDALVLGCTHYPFAAAHLRTVLGASVQLVDTGAPVARQARRLLEAADSLANPAAGGGTALLLATGDTAALQAASARWLGLRDTAVLALP
jgi:glutamate racemase